MDVFQKVAEVVLITEFKGKSNLVYYNNCYINILLAANLCVIHTKRVIIMEKDMRLVCNICNKILGFSYPGGQRQGGIKKYIEARFFKEYLFCG